MMSLNATMSTILRSTEGPWLLEVENIDALKDYEEALILDGSKMSNLDGFYNELAEKLQFPRGFGRNFNALSEMLSDLSWLEKDSYIILIENASSVLEEVSPQSREAFWEILSEVGEEWSLPITDGEPWDRPAKPFHTVISS